MVRPTALPTPALLVQPSWPSPCQYFFAPPARPHCPIASTYLPHPAQPEAEDPVDPKPKVDAACHKSCVREFADYEKCKERIQAKGTGSCEPWFFD